MDHAQYVQTEAAPTRPGHGLQVRGQHLMSLVEMKRISLVKGSCP